MGAMAPPVRDSPRPLALDDLRAALRAAAAVTGLGAFRVVGSAAVLGTAPGAPAGVRTSADIDLYPEGRDDLQSLITRRLGLGSAFHRDHGFYVDGAGDWAGEKAPPGWGSRLAPVDAGGGVTGGCMSLPDLAAMKVRLGRPKDLAYVGALVRHGLVDGAALGDLIRAHSPPGERARDIARLESVAGEAFPAQRAPGAPPIGGPQAMAAEIRPPAPTA